jgi:hypothetical protein
MTPPNIPEDHDAPAFGIYDDPNHDTQDGRWIGYAFIAGIVVTIILVVWIGR